MKQKTILVLFVIAVMLGSMAIQASDYQKIIRLTVINKSGANVTISMVGEIFQFFYYLTIPLEQVCGYDGVCVVTGGTKDDPTERVFTVPADIYHLTIGYVNGDFSQTIIKRVDMTGNTTLKMDAVNMINTCEEWELGEPLPKNCETVYLWKNEDFSYVYQPAGWNRYKR